MAGTPLCVARAGQVRSAAPGTRPLLAAHGLHLRVDVQFQSYKGKCLMNVMTSRIQTRPESDGLRNA